MGEFPYRYVAVMLREAIWGNSGRFCAIWDDFDVGFGQIASVYKEGDSP
jgi:hypothetical protein